ncbi:unnamed protein product [Ectocarpus sp. CCAP 1310/34]|nr:unnamed protein product [Ectocarpus sp. CCAP 1310/34]
MKRAKQRRPAKQLKPAEQRRTPGSKNKIAPAASTRARGLKQTKSTGVRTSAAR